MGASLSNDRHSPRTWAYRISPPTAPTSNAAWGKPAREPITIVAQIINADAVAQVSQVTFSLRPAPARRRAPMSQATVRTPNTATT